MLLIGNLSEFYYRLSNRWNTCIRKHIVIPCIRKSIGGDINQSFLCNNCTGAMMMHDMGKRFDSPTVNLWMTPKDFLYLVKNIRFLSKKEIVDVTPIHNNYPIGMLGNCKIHFLHYKTFKDAIDCWNRRIKRLNMNNMYLILVETNPLSLNEIEDFNRLPYKKVLLTRTDNKNISCAFRIKYPANKKDFQITDYLGLKGLRYYDQFNFVNFFKQKS